MNELKNYLKSTYRNFIRHKVYSFINLLGLVIGITAFIIITFFVNYQNSYDNFHTDADNIYRIIRGGNGSSEYFAGSPAPLAPLLSKDIPEVKSYLRIGKSSWNDKNLITSGDISFYESTFYLADSNFFTFFSYPLKYGNPTTVLSESNSIVITERTAKKFFGEGNPLGEIVIFNNEHKFKITGIAFDPPVNSHLNFDFIVPFDMLDTFYGEGSLTRWGTYNYFSYICLHDNTDLKIFKNKFSDCISRALDDPDRVESINTSTFQPLSDIHLRTVRYNLLPSFERKYLYILTAIGYIILLVSCINYMNITTSRSFRRAREVGLRKVVGASRSKLILQFLGESLFYVLIALVISLVLASYLTPKLNSFLNVPIIIDYLSPAFILNISFVTLFVTLVSGSYPAFYISSYQPATVLKSGFLGKKGVTAFRNTLVVIQFFISIVLISATIIIHKQLNFVQNKDLGLNQEMIISIPLYDKTLRSKAEIIKAEIIRNPNVETVSANRFLPTRGTWHHTVWWEGMKEDESLSMWFFVFDHDFIPAFEIEVVKGRNFSAEYSTDQKEAYLLNEAAVKALNLNDPIGKQFSAHGSDNRGTIIGVVKDFNFRSLHHAVEPCCIKMSSGSYDQLSLKLVGSNPYSAIKSIEKDWNKMGLGSPFEYIFISDDFEQLYGVEAQSGQIISIFTIISYFLSCLGLFGLIAHSAKERTREIGLRKVFGATVGRIILIVARDYSKLILLSFIIAIPVTIAIMNNWLQNFEYRINVGAWIFLIAGFITTFITFLTILYQSLKSAFTNPVDTLKYE